MVKTSPSTAGSVGSSPGQRTKAPHAMRCSRKGNKKERERKPGSVGKDDKCDICTLVAPEIPLK